MAKQRHLRPGDRLDDSDIVVVRGGNLDDDRQVHFSIPPGLVS